MKIVFKCIFGFLLLMVTPSFIHAFSYTSISDLGYDTNLVDPSGIQYLEPSTFYVSQVTTSSTQLSTNPESWVKALYYYSVTRMHLADIPYNYLIDENGLIYEGHSGGIGANPELKSLDKAVLVGYLSNNPVLTTRASLSLKDLVDTISLDWGISSVQSVSFKIYKEEGKLSSLVVEKLTNGEFPDSVAEVFQSWKGYTTQALKYKAKIEEVIYEKDAVIGTKLHVKVKVKNMNTFPWITDKNPIYISVKDSEESTFAVNGVWDSFSKPTNSAGKTVKPNEILELEFDMQVNTQPGESSESFEILKFEKQPFENSSFEVKFNISKGSYNLVQVSSPQYDFVNVRECQWYSCKIIESVDNGVVFILLKEENGWMKIQYNEDTIGWVYSKYMKKI